MVHYYHSSHIRMLVTFYLFAWLSNIVRSSVINVVLIGSTGDLAKKYLWESLFISYVERESTDEMRVYAAATRNYVEGSSIIQQYLDDLHCKKIWTDETCAYGYKSFVNSTSYVQLRGDDEYKALGNLIDGSNETLRIFYLSISPSLYNDVASKINRYARPPIGELRVIFEKPFGKDLKSAIELSEQLQSQLSDEEIFRVDHYLGKIGMRMIVDFQRLNAPLLHTLRLSRSGALLPSSQSPPQPQETTVSSDGLLSSNAQEAVDPHHGHVIEVDVSMTETEDAAGRTAYYDQYGVVRDVMQNHLTQALVYSLMRLDQTPPPSASSNHPQSHGTFGELQDRLEVLKSLQYNVLFSDSGGDSEKCVMRDRNTHSLNELEHSSLRIGQYAGYTEHLREDFLQAGLKNSRSAGNVEGTADLVLLLEQQSAGISSNTPTAATAVFTLPSVGGNRFVATVSAAKAVSAREMFLRVTSSPTSNPSEICSMVFGIQGSNQNIKVSESKYYSGPYFQLEGACWTAVSGETIAVPQEWAVTAKCHRDIRVNLNHSVAEHPSSEIFASELPSSGSAASPMCVFTPIEQRQVKSFPLQGSEQMGIGVDDQLLTVTRPQTMKFAGNAYVEILSALFRRDKSYFTTTDELHAQWAMWDGVLKDCQCLSPQSYHKEWPSKLSK